MLPRFYGLYKGSYVSFFTKLDIYETWKFATTFRLSHLGIGKFEPKTRLARVNRILRAQYIVGHGDPLQAFAAETALENLSRAWFDKKFSRNEAS